MLDKGRTRAFVRLQINTTLVENAEHRPVRVDTGAAEHAAHLEGGKGGKARLHPLLHRVARLRFETIFVSSRTSRFVSADHRPQCR